MPHFDSPNLVFIFVIVQSPSRVQLFATPWAAAHKASLSFPISQSLPKFMSIESVMPWLSVITIIHPLLLLPSIFPSIKVFSNESVLHIRWPEYWSFTFSIQSFQHLSIVSLTFTTPLLGRQNLHSYYIKEEIEKQTSSSIKSSN